MLHLARIYYPVTSLGPGNRVGVWLAGCQQNCKNCISPELKTTSNGREMSTKDIMNYINSIDSDIDGFTISGGEPFLDSKALLELVKELEYISDDIIIYTGYLFESLLKDKASSKILSIISVLIDGPYIEELNDGYGIRGSSNQRIIILKKKERYNALERCERTIQNIVYNNAVLNIGIPKRRLK